MSRQSFGDWAQTVLSILCEVHKWDDPYEYMTPRYDLDASLLTGLFDLYNKKTTTEKAAEKLHRQRYPADVLWVRIGDGSEYQEFDCLESVATALSESRCFAPVTFINKLGVTDGVNYQGQNYVSLYWGGQDCEDVECGLTRKELAELNRHLKRINLSNPDMKDDQEHAVRKR
jgi:hypothetical protein